MPIRVMPTCTVERKLVGSSAELQRPGGAAAAGLGHRLQALAAGGDDGELGHCEEAVENDEDQDDQDRPEHAFPRGPAVPASMLGEDGEGCTPEIGRPETRAGRPGKDAGLQWLTRKSSMHTSCTEHARRICRNDSRDRRLTASPGGLPFRLEECSPESGDMPEVEARSRHRGDGMTARWLNIARKHRCPFGTHANLADFTLEAAETASPRVGAAQPGPEPLLPRRRATGGDLRRAARFGATGRRRLRARAAARGGGQGARLALSRLPGPRGRASGHRPLHHGLQHRTLRLDAAQPRLQRRRGREPFRARRTGRVRPSPAEAGDAAGGDAGAVRREHPLPVQAGGQQHAAGLRPQAARRVRSSSRA